MGTTTVVIKTRTKAPLVVIAIWPSTADGTLQARLAGYAYSAKAAAKRKRYEDKHSGPQTRHVVLPVEDGKVTVELTP